MTTRTLACHSRGDKRFSPFFCWVDAFGIRDTIEDHYQKSKVFVSPTGLVFPSGWKEAKQWKREGLPRHDHFRLPNGLMVPVQYHIYGWYSALWLKYLDAHPQLVAEASTYDEFVDIFQYDFPLSQADCIRLYCKQGRASLLELCLPFFGFLKETK
jgi:hypothetical protein